MLHGTSRPAVKGMSGRPAVLRRAVTVCVTLLAHVLPVLAAAQGEALTNSSLSAAVRRHATLHCIGIEWDIEGDANHNATCEVEYRRQGRAEWSRGMPLLRIDYRGWYVGVKADRHYNMLAGSIFFLKPGVLYDVRLTLKDPDGGNRVEEFSIPTRPVPTAPTAGRTFHVAPGDGGGVGVEADPFKGLQAALAAAQPGDVFQLHGGRYGRFNLHFLGAADRPQPKPGDPHVVWRAAGDGEALFDRVDLRVHNTWLDGLTFRGEGGHCLTVQNAPANVVLTRNHFTGFNYAINMYGAGEGWYIADNVIVGDKDRATKRGFDKPTEGEGVELGHTSGHVVCYNTISRVADGVSYPGRNCDIYGNDIFQVSDDGLEPDSGYANVRMWGNRVHAYVAGVSFQPMLCGPWYLIRNQVIGNQECFKMRVCDRFVMVNNTFVGPKFMCGFAFRLLSCVSRNNLWYHTHPARYVWMAHVMSPEEAEKQKEVINYEGDEGFKPNWKTDLDYDGFGSRPNPPGKFMGSVFGWYSPATKKQEAFGDVASFSKFLGVEAHGRDIEAEKVFERYEIPEALHLEYPKGELPPQWLTLREGSNAVDAGDRLPNLHDDWFTGAAPDLGAYEFGHPLPHYGVRDAQAMNDHATYWMLKRER